MNREEAAEFAARHQQVIKYGFVVFAFLVVCSIIGVIQNRQAEVAARATAMTGGCVESAKLAYGNKAATVCECTVKEMFRYPAVQENSMGPADFIILWTMEMMNCGKAAGVPLI